jgi:hypothetical protein
VTQKVRLESLESEADIAAIWIGKSYPKSGFGRPTPLGTPLSFAVGWAWYQWHLKADFKSISKQLMATLKMVVKTYAAGDSRVGFLDGAAITHDDIWFPNAFVTAVTRTQKRK